MMLLKFSIGLIVMEGLACEFIIALDKAPYSDDGTFSTEEKQQRAYCKSFASSYDLHYIIQYMPHIHMHLHACSYNNIIHILVYDYMYMYVASSTKHIFIPP